MCSHYAANGPLKSCSAELKRQECNMVLSTLKQVENGTVFPHACLCRRLITAMRLLAVLNEASHKHTR